MSVIQTWLSCATTVTSYSTTTAGCRTRGIMSIRFIGSVWDSGLYDGPRLLMMLALADHADDDGWCFPSYETLALKIRRNSKTVYRVLADLESEGAIRRAGGRIGICEPDILEEAQRRAGASRAKKQTAPRPTPESQVLIPENDFLIPENDFLNIEKPFYIEPSINRHLSPLDELANVFTQRTTIGPNRATGDYEAKWENPLQAILDRAGGDLEQAKVILNASIDVAVGHNDSGKVYPVASPWSLRKISFNQANKQQSAVSGADDDSLWQRALQAVARRDYSDERLKAAIRAIGGSQAVASANGHNTDQLRRKLAHEYRRNPATA